jgi:pimeloyl-ACP methyl ester carboxylesterase
MNPTTFLLVHGSWQGAWSWQPVRHHLHAAGSRTLAPTLAGHAPDDDRSVVTFADYVDSVLRVLDGEADGPVVLVGHSFGGAVISRVAELRPERCRSLIYYSAFVPRDGESVGDSLPAAMVELFGQLAGQSADRSVALPYELFRTAFANAADDATAEGLFARFSPEPYRPIFEPIALPAGHAFAMPAAYIWCRHDRTLPPGTFHPGQSGRLHRPKLIEVDGDHEALWTNPRALAEALLAAVAPESVLEGL